MTAFLRNELELFQSSLANEIENLDPDLLIPRGDALRHDLAAQKNRDEFSRTPPLPDDVVAALAKLVASYNYYVSLDPELALRDEALLGPDAKRGMVPPAEGQAVVRDAVLMDAATPRAAEALAEEAKVAPSVPDTDSRQSRRYSEGVKNLARKAVELSVEFVALVWSNKGKVGAVGSGLYAAAKWVSAQREWLLTYFADNSSMVDIIHKVLKALDQLPMS